MLPEIERERIKKRIAAWRRAAPELQRIRDEEIRNTDTLQALQQLARCFQQAARELPHRTDSGLVAQQALFHKASTK